MTVSKMIKNGAYVLLPYVLMGLQFVINGIDEKNRANYDIISSLRAMFVIYIIVGCMIYGYFCLLTSIHPKTRWKLDVWNVLILAFLLIDTLFVHFFPQLNFSLLYSNAFTFVCIFLGMYFMDMIYSIYHLHAE